MRHLVLCAHGTDSPSGRQTVLDIRAAVEAAMPDLVVHDAYVDVQEPSISDVMKQLSAEAVAVIPLLLCTGYHVQVDIARAIAAHGNAHAARSLGPDPDLTALLVERLEDAGAQRGEPVILAAAGSSRPQASADAQAAAALLEQAWGGRVTAAFGSAASPSVDDAVKAARDAGERAVVASYLLGHGFFHTKLARTGADVVTEPLGAHPRVAAAVRNRLTELGF